MCFEIIFFKTTETSLEWSLDGPLDNVHICVPIKNS